MPRIPDQIITQLKRDIDLKAVVAASGVDLEQRGDEWFGLCCLQYAAPRRHKIRMAQDLRRCPISFNFCYSYTGKDQSGIFLVRRKDVEKAVRLEPHLASYV